MTPRRLAGSIPAVLAMALGAVGSSAQVEHEGEIEGVVRDVDSNQPLAGAMVSIDAAAGMAVSHGDGTFHVPVPGPRIYTVRVERLGYRTVSLEVDASSAELVVVEMEANPIPLPRVVVTGSLVARAANEVLRPTSVFAGEDLQRRLAGTLAETLSSEPGLAVSTMGPASAHPVIRGLSGDRILMLEDGERVGDQFASGPDHATAIDPSSARRIEVIRGPGAILYGSNALGGIINVVRDDVPSSVPHHLHRSVHSSGPERQQRGRRKPARHVWPDRPHSRAAGARASYEQRPEDPGRSSSTTPAFRCLGTLGRNIMGGRLGPRRHHFPLLRQRLRHPRRIRRGSRSRGSHRDGADRDPAQEPDQAPGHLRDHRDRCGIHMVPTQGDRAPRHPGNAFRAPDGQRRTPGSPRGLGTVLVGRSGNAGFPGRLRIRRRTVHSRTPRTHPSPYSRWRNSI